MVIQHNINSLNTYNCLKTTNKNFLKSTEKLSSGYRINRAADDAAGLTISEKMRWQIRGLNRAARNITDGISFCNVAEGALSEVNSMLGRMKELSVQAANDTNTDSDRAALDAEVQQLTDELDNIFKTTSFNTKKVWCATYIPAVTGEATDFSFYNTTDSIGTYVGGIQYMNHRYSWEDLGIDYDRATQTFTDTVSKRIDSRILKDDSATLIDDKGQGAFFDIKTVKGEALNTAQKTYSWKADNTGIIIDGVRTDGTNADEGNTSWAAMGITPGADVSAGTYTFKYYGLEISFDVPDGGADWTTFIDGINNQFVHIDWHSVNVGATSNQSADITSFDSTKVTVTAANKDKISTSGYKVVANKNDGLSVKYDDGVLSSTSWNNIPDISGNNSKVNSWGDGAGGSAYVTVNDKSVYKYDDSTKGGFISYEYKLDEDGSPESIINDIGNTTISADTHSPTAITVGNNSNINSKVTVTGTSDIGFDTQRDDFSRAFAQNYEIISNSGIVSEKETAPGIINHIISFGTDETTFTCDYNINAHLAEQLINARENLLSRYNSNIPPDVPPDNESLKLGTVSYTFTNRSNTAGEFNKIKLVYDLSRLTYGDVKNLSKYSNINNNFWDYADSIIYANKSVTLKGNGETYQNLSCNEVSVTEQSTKNSAGVFGFKQEVLIQAGALNEQTIGISYDFLRTGNIGLGGISLLTYSDSESAISQIDKAIEKVSEQRAVFGAYTNRLERAYNVNMNNSENTQAAESRIRDTDFSEELIDYSKQNILSQVGQSMLAQANQQDKQVLSLIE